MARAVSSGENVEISSLRDESSETYATPDGDLEAVQHLRPVRARVDGGWKDLDNTLVKDGDGSVSPRVAAVGMTLSGGGSGPLVRLEQAGRKLAYTWPTSLPEPVLEGDVATYRDVLPEVDLQLRADGDGLSQLLVVRTAEAAKNPDLAQLKMGVVAPGLEVRTTSDGGLEARDTAAGGVVFEAPQPMMWDSGDMAESFKREATQSDPAKGPTDSSKLAPIGVDLDPDGSALTLTPDQSMLTEADTTFPVYIDPQTYTPKAGEWAMVSRYHASTPSWRFGKDPDAGVGYCAWDYCAPFDLKRLFYRLPTSRFAGKTILSATFVGHETWSGSCDASDIELWRTKSFSSSTTWNSSQDNWLDRLDTRSVAKGGKGCAAAGDVEFDAAAGVKYAASHDSAYTSFGLQATDEDDRNSWKRFSDDAYLRVRYNAPPKQIKMSQLAMSPGGSCHKPDAKVPVNTLGKIIASDVTDPDGDQVSVQYQAWWDTGDSKGFAARWTSAKSTPKKSGSDFSTTLPGTVPRNQTVAWSCAGDRL